MTTNAADPAVLLAALCLGFISILPWVYFRGGRCHARWWLTTLPFVAADIALIGALFGLVGPWPAAAASIATRALSVTASAAALVLLGAALAAHDNRPVKYHQVEDAPPALVTRGPYSAIRHPFYVSYVLALLGCALALPNPLTAGAFIVGTLELWRTAAHEEARLLKGTFATQYAQYVRVTGRFLPRP